MKNNNNPLAYMTKSHAKFLLVVLDQWREKFDVEGNDLYFDAFEIIERIANAKHCDLFKSLPKQDESVIKLFAHLDALEELRENNN